MKDKEKKLTTASGKPYFENKDSMTVGSRGPIMLQDFYLHEKLAERILFLRGEVEMKASGEVKKIHDVKAMLNLAARMETSSTLDYNKWADECSKNADAISKILFEELVGDEERHFDPYNVEMENMKKSGDHYLALQSIERSKNRASGKPAAN